MQRSNLINKLHTPRKPQCLRLIRLLQLVKKKEVLVLQVRVQQLPKPIKGLCFIIRKLLRNEILISSLKRLLLKLVWNSRKWKTHLN